MGTIIFVGGLFIVINVAIVIFIVSIPQQIAENRKSMEPRLKEIKSTVNRISDIELRDIEKRLTNIERELAKKMVRFWKMQSIP